MSGDASVALPTRARRTSPVRQRLASAAVGLPILLAMIYFGGWFYVAGILFCAVASAIEVVSMGRRAGYAPSAIIVIGGTTLLTLAPLVPAAGGETAGALTITVVLLAALAYLLHRADAGVAAPSALADFLLTLGGTVYVGLLFGYLVALRMLPDGRGYLALLLLAIFAADTGAFVVGRRWGRRRLSPAISPNKTFEGALGGLAAGVLSALALVWLLGLPFAWWQSLLIGALVTLAGMLGDLAESALKRGLGAKDAGGLIPGHGGMLDRADSLLVAGVVLYFAVRTLGPVS